MMIRLWFQKRDCTWVVAEQIGTDLLGKCYQAKHVDILVNSWTEETGDDRKRPSANCLVAKGEIVCHGERLNPSQTPEQYEKICIEEIK